ncbi:MAG: GntR family transcriptional regulator [Clostridium sp.]|nr:GntR family transcriptional regulator [Acetatifactor muris]MCM1525979.1 GntR family transcriptional regulator [Bacteroides sp.]MCM1562261.1 GntR family transcriptional regulator [Clostridium sp.]
MIVIDYRDKRPLYEQVTEKIEHLIICGALSPNTKLPSVRALAMDLCINPNTVQRAYACLEQEGYIYTVVGRGNYVTEPAEWRKGKLLSLERELRDCMTEAATAGLPEETVLRLMREIYGRPHPESGKEDPSHD